MLNNEVGKKLNNESELPNYKPQMQTLRSAPAAYQPITTIILRKVQFLVWQNHRPNT